MSKVLNKRVDIQVFKPQMAMLELQKAIQDGFVIDTTNRGGVVKRGNHILIELVKGVSSLETTTETTVSEQVVGAEVVKDDIKPKPQTKPRQKPKPTEDVSDFL